MVSGFKYSRAGRGWLALLLVIAIFIQAATSVPAIAAQPPDVAATEPQQGETPNDSRPASCSEDTGETDGAARSDSSSVTVASTSSSATIENGTIWRQCAESLGVSDCWPKP